VTLMAEAVRLARAGHRPAEISERLGCQSKTVWEVLSRARRAGEDVPRAKPGSVPGERLPSTVRVPTLAERIKMLAAAGRGEAAIAETLGVSMSAVRRALQRP